MPDIFIDGVCQSPSAEVDQPIETLPLVRPDEVLRVRVRIGVPGREPNRSKADALKKIRWRGSEQRISVVDQIPRAKQKAIMPVEQ